MRKFLFFTVLLSMLSVLSQAQNYYMGNTADGSQFQNNTTVTTCKGFISNEVYLDPGGAYKYFDGQTYIMTFCSGGGSIKINVTFADIASGDHLYVYDGSSTGATQIGNITNISTTLGQSFTSSGTCLTLKFTSNTDGVQGEGYDAIIGCVPSGCNGNSAAGDACASATMLCDSRPYCGNTSGWYTADSETIGSGEETGTFVNGASYADGYQYHTGTIIGNNLFCGSIENNSWISFVAQSSAPTFSVSSTNCTDASSGIQAAMYSTPNCSSFTQVSTSCVSQSTGSGGFSLAGSGLTIGQTYYIMIDGFAGNYCDYQITAQTGVTVYNITAAASPLCPGQSTTLSLSPSPAVGTTYSWTGSTANSISGNSTTSSSSSISATPPSTTTYTCHITTPTGCSSDIIYTLTVNPNPTVNVSGTTSICSGTSTTLTASGASSYVWQPGSISSTGIVVSPVNTTTYSCTGTTSGCSTTTVVTINVTASPTLNPSASPTIVCTTGSTTLNAGASASATNFTWSPSGGNASTATVTPGSSGLYTVTATNGGACPVSATVSVTVVAPPTMTISGTGTLCSGSGSLTLTGGSASSYTWMPGSVNTNTISVSPSSTTIYTLTGSNGVCTNSTTATVSVTTTPTISPQASQANICSGTTTTLSANASPAATTYTWSPGAGSASTATVAPSSTQIYTLTVTNGGKCPVTGTVAVTVTTTPTMTITGTGTLCSGSGSLTLTGGSASNYTWMPGSVNTNTISVSPGSTTVYTLTGANGACTGSTTATVSVTTTPTISPQASQANICSGTTTTLSSNASPAATTYTWSPGAGSASTATVAPTSTQVYTLTVTNGGKCPVTGTVAVTVTTTPTMTITGTGTLCSGSGSLTLTGGSASNYTWMPGSVNTNTISVSPGSTTVYTLTGANGACTGSTTATVSVTTTPTISPQASQANICSGTTTTLSSNASPAATTYTWSPGTGSASTATVAPSSSQIYTLTVTNGGKCPVTGTVAVTVTTTPTMTITGNAPICSGNTVTLTGQSASNYTWLPGNQNSASISVSPSTTTVYTLTGANGVCTASTTATLSVTATPTITPSASPSSFCSTASSTLSANANSATTYTWSSGAGNTATVVVTPNASQTYTLTVTNSGACPVSSVVSVTVTPTPTMNIGAVAPICNGQSATLSGGNATSYTWAPGNSGTPSIVVSPTVTSTYTLTGANGTCTAQAVSTVTVNPLPQVASQTITSAPCGQSTGCIDITVTGGAPTYTYTWNGGSPSTTSSFCNHPTGTYGVLITDANGCTINPNFTIPAQNGPPVPQIASTPTVVCVGDTASVSASINPADPNVTFSWSDNAGTHAGSSYTITNIQPPGIYTLNVTATDITNGCQNSSTMSFSVNPLPNILTAASPTVICVGQNTTLNASGANSFTWSANASSAQSSTVSVSPNSSDTFTVTGNSAGCVSTATVSVMVNPLPVITTTASPATICNGQSTILTAGGATTYTWSTNTVNDSITVSPNANATYTVTGETSNCISTQTVGVNVTPLPSLTITPSPASICVGQTSTLTAGGATTYTWSSNAGGGTTSPVTVSPTTTTSYTLAGTQNGCSDSTVVTVSIGTPPTITVGSASSVMCSGTSNTLTASGALNYTWMPGSLSGDTVTISPTSTTVYTVIATAGGCPTIDTIRVNVTPTPTINATTNNANICSGSSATLTATGSTNYTWTPGGATSATIVVSPTVTTTYTVVSDSAQCTSAQKTVVVNVTTTPTVSAVNSSTTAICSSQSTTLTAGGATTYAWNPGGVGGSIVVTPAATQTYTLTGLNGSCADSTTITVNVTPTPTLSVTGNTTPICAGQTATLTASGAANYTWQPTGATTSVITVTPSNTAVYTLTGDTAGCPSVKSFTVNVNPIPTLAPFANQTACANGPVNGISFSAGSASVTWTNTNANTGIATSGAGDINGYTAPGVTSQEIGIITATPTYTNTGCVGQPQSDTIIINPLPQVSLGSLDSALCGAANGGVKNITVTGNQPFHYQWFNNGVAVPGDTTADLSNVGIGSYSLQVMDGNGCLAQGPNTSYSVPGSVAVVAGFSQDVYMGQAPLVVTFSNTTTGASGYNWNFGNGSSNQANPAAIYDAMGTYTVVLTAYNGSCVDTATALVVVDAATSIIVPNVYSPNGDGVNDEWFVQCTGMKTLKCEIYNRWGQLVYTLNGPNDVWTGVMNNGNMATEGTYYYILNAEGYDKKAYKSEGHLTLVK